MCRSPQAQSAPGSDGRPGRRYAAMRRCFAPPNVPCAQNRQVGAADADTVAEGGRYWRNTAERSTETVMRAGHWCRLAAPKGVPLAALARSIFQCYPLGNYNRRPNITALEIWMDLFFQNKRLQKAAVDEAVCRREYGVEMAKKFALRLASLRAAASLADFWPPKSGPERCHELKGELDGTFSVDLKQPYRLLFRPAEPVEPLPDEQERWRSITSIEIVSIEDTHG